MTLPTDKLRNVRRIVTHAGCPDGIASALILRDVLPDAEVEFVAYDSTQRDLRASEGMLFCDMTPPRHRAREFVGEGAIVLDHHRSQREVVEVVEAFGPLGVFADEDREPGVSGAVLAFREVWEPLEVAAEIDRESSMLRTGTSVARRDHVQEFAAMAGVRDTWRRDSPLWEQACEQAAALVFYPRSFWLKGGEVDSKTRGGGVRVNWHAVFAACELGKILRVRDRERDDRAFQRATFFYARIPYSSNRLLVAVVNTLAVSDLADVLARRSGADVTVGFEYGCEGPKDEQVAWLNCSVRSRGDFDCSALAKSRGGGGHRHAAGWRDALPACSPYQHVERLFRDFLDVGGWE